MDKYKALFNKYKKAIIAVAALLVVGFGAKFALDAHNNNIVNRVSMKFTGYEGHGSAELSNYESVAKYMATVALKKEGVKKDSIKNILSSNFDTSALSAEDQVAVKSAQSDITSTRLDFKGKSTNLKNGDKVTIQFKNYNSEMPFKNGTKTFTVKGLKKTNKVSAKEIFDKLNVKAIGINGKGQIALSSKKSALIDSKISIKNNGSLSNGDTVSIKLPDSAFKDSTGKNEYTGSHTFDYKVSGLIDNKAISNIDDIKSATDTVMSDYTDDQGFEDDEYTSKFVNLYVNPYDGNEDEYYNNDESDEVSSKVEVSDSRETSSSTSNRLSIIAIYTVSRKDSDDDSDPSNVAVTVNDLSIKDQKLNIGDKKITSGDNVSSFDDSIKTFERNLEVTGLKLK
ncbi:hypothetical protein FEZ51_06465 [Pediococcus stilesii]|uniref:Uncharacterized protein n=1 Tax=Pediococcus stilesii TaxID=331679 RepID=A0A5R9BTY2_9LACO|nr:hypothetical protein [Pediococcus stilesii]TLQ04065.1 hypothetical protein FEZ51_06465 [Pediococcus stilesii]